VSAGCGCSDQEGCDCGDGCRIHGALGAIVIEEVVCHSRWHLDFVEWSIWVEREMAD
jgi:hypothetical protein